MDYTTEAVGQMSSSGADTLELPFDELADRLDTIGVVDPLVLNLFALIC